MMTSGQARAVYLAGEETVVRTLLEMDARMDEQMAAMDARIAGITGEFETQVRDLTVRLEVSEKRVKHLEDRLAKNSSNSGKPPSTDGFNRPAPKSLRQKSARPTGGQPGHPGSALSMAAEPDHIEIHPAPDVCADCGKALADRPAEKFERRQVHDLPAKRMIVTEHRAEAKACTCGCLNTAPFPTGVTAPVQYGPNVKAAAVYLKNFQLLPYERACELFADLFGCRLSEGTLANILEECGDLLKAPVAKIKALIAGAPVAHFDETGSRVDKDLWWAHVASTANATVYDINPKRGTEAMDAMGILPAFTGRAIHDHWKPYFRYACQHGLCNAHHLRELTFSHEQDHQPWAKSMITCLVDMKAVVDQAALTATSLTQFQVRMFRRRYQAIIEEGYAQNPPAPAVDGKREQAKQSKSRNLLERLDKHRSQVQAFVTDFTVPFSNNLAERDIRMIKVQQKVSGPFRSEHGARTFCRIRSYISTARKNALGTLEAIQRVFAGSPFVPLSAANTS